MKIFWWILGIIVFCFVVLIAIGYSAQSALHDEYVMQCTKEPTRHPNQVGVCECAADQFMAGTTRKRSEAVGEWYAGSRTFHDMLRLYGEHKVLEDVTRCNIF